MNDRYPSQLLENAVNELAKLPTIGKKSAMRLAFHLLKRTEIDVENLGNALIKLRKETNYCTVCHNISDSDMCAICANPRRDSTTVCVVENFRDVISVENTQQYNGLYHVLGGIISPMEGIGPNDLEIESLLDRVRTGKVKEVVLAISTTMEGDTTNFYLFRKLTPLEVKITTIARGVAIGNELEYTDEVTLGRSILNRIEFTNTYK